MRRGLATAGLLSFTVGSILFSLSAATAAQADPDTGVAASSEGFDATLTIPNAPLSSTPLDLAMPSAQASADVLGSTLAFAADPYPGDLVLNGPGLLNGAAGTSVPSYPLYAEATYPGSPNASVDLTGITMNATAQAGRAQARSTAGVANGPVSIAESSASSTVTQAEDQTWTASARSDVQSVTIEGVVTIGHVVSMASVAQSPGTSPGKQATLTIEGMTVAGQAVAISNGSLTIDGSPVADIPTNPVDQVLAAAGISIQYLSGTSTDTSVSAPMLEVTAPVAVPGQGTGILALRFGGASASVGALDLTGLAQPSTSQTSITSGVGSAAGSNASGTSGGGASVSSTVAPAIATPISSPASNRQTLLPAVHRGVLGMASGLLATQVAVGLYVVLALAAVATVSAGGLVSRLRKGP